MPQTNTPPKLVNAPVNTDTLIAKYRDQKAKIAILGMGYVGFPLALATHEKGFDVLAFDVDAKKVDMLNAGKSYLKDIPDSDVANMKNAGRFEASCDAASLASADALLMCVPTPLSKYREPDLSYVLATIKTIAANLRPGQLVVLESTTYPGTTAEVITPMLEETGLRVGIDFFVAYSPEREDPGNEKFDTATIPKVVGADDDVSRAMAEALYEGIIDKAVPVSSAAAAEAVKLTENIFRSVNIALVNELKVVYDKMGIDVWEVIDAAATKPFGFMPFYPGPGVGGHCIPIDPFYLTWKSREFGMSTRFIELAGQINERMHDYVIGKLREGLDKHHKKGLNGSTILMLGVAYKPNVDDMRESPALFIAEKMEAAGATMIFHDAYVPEIPSTREHASLTGRKSVPLDAETIAGADAVLVATNHKGVDMAFVAKHAKLIVDTRNATKDLPDSDKIIKA